jgi:PIN domain nuclease of toxin-antitoxin system
VKFLLDTNAVIALVRREPRFMKRAREQSPSEFGISSIAAHELYFGAYKSDRLEENLARIEYLRLSVVVSLSSTAKTPKKPARCVRFLQRQEHLLVRMMFLSPVKQKRGILSSLLAMSANLRACPGCTLKIGKRTSNRLAAFQPR